eukprot:GILI01016555.1.p1 GENE.GILI01016555.1~~GILI01016555.1.p1  ORF type:complete len:472 (-),score=141.82 GILI01016555.1:155-1570(-)
MAEELVTVVPDPDLTQEDFDSLSSAYLAQAPLNGVKVTFEGHKTTNSEFLNERAADLKSSRSLGEFLNEVGRLKQDLDSLGIFDKVNLYIDKDSNDCAEVKVKLVEGNRLRYGTHGLVSPKTGEVEAEMSLSVKNVQGRAEHLDFNVTKNPFSKSYNYGASYVSPFFSEWLRMQLTLGQSLIDRSRIASFHEKQQGGTVTFSMREGGHSLGLQMFLRDGIPQTNPAFTLSNAVMRQMMPSLKASLVHSFVHSTIPISAPAPLAGTTFEVQNELAGLTGDAKFFKTQARAQQRLSLGQGLVLRLSASAGLLQPLGRDALEPFPTRIYDRFFIGGTNHAFHSLKGFDLAGVGPREQRVAKPGSPPAQGSDALGGDIYATSEAALLYYPPGTRSLGLKFFAFGSAGNLMPLRNVRRVDRAFLDSFKSTARLSAGVGVGLKPFGLPFTLDLSYATHVKAQPDDLTAKLQFGVSMS